MEAMSGRRLRQFEDSAGAGSRRWQPEAEQQRRQPEAERHRRQPEAEQHRRQAEAEQQRRQPEAEQHRQQPEAEQQRQQAEAEQQRQQALAERHGHLFLRGHVEPGRALRQVVMEYARRAVRCALLNRGGNRPRLSVDFRNGLGEGL
jgi:hypothetical protein